MECSTLFYHTDSYISGALFYCHLSFYLHLAERVQEMKLTDKRFWAIWIITEVLILSFCGHDVILCSHWEDAILVFGFCQPLMFVLTLFRKSHSSGAIINLIIVLAYSIFAGYLKINLGFGGGLYWILFMTALPNIQLLLLLLYWCIERILKRKAGNIV